MKLVSSLSFLENGRSIRIGIGGVGEAGRDRGWEWDGDAGTRRGRGHRRLRLLIPNLASSLGLILILILIVSLKRTELDTTFDQHDRVLEVSTPAVHLRLTLKAPEDQNQK